LIKVFLCNFYQYFPVCETVPDHQYIRTRRDLMPCQAFNRLQNAMPRLFSLFSTYNYTGNSAENQVFIADKKKDAPFGASVLY